MAKKHSAVIEVKVDRKGNFSFKEFGDETEGFSKKGQRSLGSFSGAGVAAMGAVGVAAGLLVSRGLAAISRGAQEAIDDLSAIGPVTQGFDTSVARLGTTADTMISSLRGATLGLVDDFTLMTQANQAMTLGVATSEKQYADLVGAATKLGRTLGVDTKRAVESITTGIARQSVQWLDNLGIIINADKASADYAATIGKSVDALDQSERKLAFQKAAYEATMRAAADLGDQQTGLGEVLQRVGTAWTNLRTGILETIATSPELQAMLQTIAGNFGDLNELVDDLVAGFAQRLPDALLITVTALSYVATGINGLQLAGTLVWQGLLVVLNGINVAIEDVGERVFGTLADMAEAGREWGLVSSETVDKLREMQGASKQLKQDGLDAVDDALRNIGHSMADAVDAEVAMRRALDEIRQAMKDAADAADVVADSNAELVPPTDDAEAATLRAKEQMFEAVHAAALLNAAIVRLAAGLPIGTMAIKDYGDQLEFTFSDPIDVPPPDFSGFFGGLSKLLSKASDWAVQLGGKIDTAFGGMFSKLGLDLGGLFGGAIGAGIAAAAGFVVGKLVDFVRGLFKKANVADHVATFFGRELSAGLIEAMERARAQTGGDISAAFRLLIADAIQEATVSSLADLNAWITQVHQVLSSVDEGTLSAAQAISSMGAAWLALIPSMANVGGSAMQLQGQISDLLTRFGTDNAAVIEQIQAAIQAMVAAGVGDVQQLVQWLATMGVNIEGLIEPITKAQAAWNDWVATQQAGFEEAERHNRAYFEAIAAQMGLSAATAAAWVDGMLKNQREAQAEHEKSVRKSLREQAKEAGLTGKQIREFVRANLKLMAQDERQAIRDAKKERRDAVIAQVADAKLVRDRMLTFIGQVGNAWRDMFAAAGQSGQAFGGASFSTAGSVGSFQTNPGQFRVVPGSPSQGVMAMVHGQEVIGRPTAGRGFAGASSSSSRTVINFAPVIQLDAGAIANARARRKLMRELSSEMMRMANDVQPQ